MSSIAGSVIANMARANFRSRSIKLPIDFNGFGSQAPFGSEDQKVIDPTALFQSPSTLNLHVDTVSVVGDGIGRLFEVVSNSIAKGHAAWVAGASFSGVMVNGPVGIVTPGCLNGPPTMNGQALISNAVIEGASPFFIKYVRAILGVVGSAFTEWQAGLTATLVFPMGAACSGTLPPCPNVPSSLASTSSAGDASINDALLNSRMKAAFGSGGMHSDAIFESFSTAFATVFIQWKSSTVIQGVIAAGGAAPVPPLPPGPVAGAVASGGLLA